jgi:hypothetical protein
MATTASRASRSPTESHYQMVSSLSVLASSMILLAWNLYWRWFLLEAADYSPL